MPLDVSTLTDALIAGGYIAADATAKEITKEAYQGFKRSVGELFGRRALKAAEKLEEEGTREEGKAELATVIQDVRGEEAEEILPPLQAFLDAVRADPGARSALEHARIGLDLDVVGNVLLEDIQDAREIGVRARSGGDFTLRGVRMDKGGRPGN